MSIICWICSPNCHQKPPFTYLVRIFSRGGLTPASRFPTNSGNVRVMSSWHSSMRLKHNVFSLSVVCLFVCVGVLRPFNSLGYFSHIATAFWYLMMNIMCILKAQKANLWKGWSLKRMKVKSNSQHCRFDFIECVELCSWVAMKWTILLTPLSTYF